MSSLLAEQQAISTPPQLQPERPLDDFAADPIVPKESGRLRLGFLKLDGVQHILRLRSRLQLSNQLFADVGADFSLNRKALYPRTALEYKVQNKKGSHIATLRADRRALYVQKSFPLNLRDKLTARIQATAATSYQGVPELSVGLEQVRPTWLIGVGAVALLALGKPITHSRTFGGTSINLPGGSQNSKIKGEVKASAYRNGKGLALALQQLNGILRV